MSIADVLANRCQTHVECGDSLSVLRTLPDACVQCVCTSPPYYSLRDYGVAGQIGLEATPAEFVAKLVLVFREVRRVLRPDGTLWVNMGDSYCTKPMGSGSTHAPKYPGGRNRRGSTPDGNRTNNPASLGLKHKDMLGIPWRLAFALQEDGWILRSDVPWVKRSPMPESVTDRPAKSLEYVFLMSKSPAYYFDNEAVRVTHKEPWLRHGKEDGTGKKGQKTVESGANHGFGLHDGDGVMVREYNPAGRNFRNSDLWYESLEPPFGLVFSGDELVGLDVTSEGISEAHFAAYPPALVRPLLLAGTSARGCCPDCGSPWRRKVEKSRKSTRPGDNTKVAEAVKTPPEEPGRESGPARFEKSTLQQIVGNRDPQRHCTETRTLGWEPSCECGKEPITCLVLDPFSGAATTGVVCRRLGLRYLGVELNPEYVAMSERRLRSALDERTAKPLATVPLFDAMETDNGD